MYILHLALKMEGGIVTVVKFGYPVSCQFVRHTRVKMTGGKSRDIFEIQRKDFLNTV